MGTVKPMSSNLSYAIYTLSCMKSPFVRFRVHGRYVYVLNPDIPACFDGLDDFVDGFLFSLDFHGDGTIPVISAPTGTVIESGSLFGPPAEADALDLAGKDHAFADHAFSPFRIQAKPLAVLRSGSMK